MTIPTLTTPRLTLRPWEEGDAQGLFAILQQPGIFRYFPKTTPPPRPWIDKYIQHHARHWQERGCGHWAVVTLGEGSLVGWTGLEYLPELEQVELAYLLSRDAQGKGLATDAAQAALKFGFDTCHLPEIIALVHPENTASIRVLEKCGLVFHDRQKLWGIELLRYHLQRPVE